MQPDDNHTVVMWAAKGGAGTSVTAAAAAIHEARHVLLVDLDGDQAHILGVPTEHDIGVRAWLGIVRKLVGRVGSDRGAVPILRSVRFLGPPSEPDVRVSTHPALRVFMQRVS